MEVDKEPLKCVRKAQCKKVASGLAILNSTKAVLQLPGTSWNDAEPLDNCKEQSSLMDIFRGL